LTDESDISELSGVEWSGVEWSGVENERRGPRTEPCGTP